MHAHVHTQVLTSDGSSAGKKGLPILPSSVDHLSNKRARMETLPASMSENQTPCIDNVPVSMSEYIMCPFHTYDSWKSRQRQLRKLQHIL